MNAKSHCSSQLQHTYFCWVRGHILLKFALYIAATHLNLCCCGRRGQCHQRNTPCRTPPLGFGCLWHAQKQLVVCRNQYKSWQEQIEKVIVGSLGESQRIEPSCQNIQKIFNKELGGSITIGDDICVVRIETQSVQSDNKFVMLNLIKCFFPIKKRNAQVGPLNFRIVLYTSKHIDRMRCGSVRSETVLGFRK